MHENLNATDNSYIYCYINILIHNGFGNMNIPVDDPHRRTLYINKQISVVFNIVKDP